MAESVNRKIQEYRFEQIFKEFSKPMFLYALSFVTAEEEAEDVVQEVFVNFWKDDAFAKVKDEVTKTYLFRSVKNNCLNRLDKKDVMRNRVDMIRVDVAEEEAMRWNDDLFREVEEEVDQLPEQTREIIRAVFFREMKYQEVADSLGVSINTVKTLLKNGMRHLRDQFAERMDLFLAMALFN